MEENILISFGGYFTFIYKSMGTQIIIVHLIEKKIKGEKNYFSFVVFGIKHEKRN